MRRTIAFGILSVMRTRQHSKWAPIFFAVALSSAALLIRNQSATATQSESYLETLAVTKKIASDTTLLDSYLNFLGALDAHYRDTEFSHLLKKEIELIKGELVNGDSEHLHQRLDTLTKHLRGKPESEYFQQKVETYNNLIANIKGFRNLNEQREIASNSWNRLVFEFPKKELLEKYRLFCFYHYGASVCLQGESFVDERFFDATPQQIASLKEALDKITLPTLFAEKRSVCNDFLSVLTEVQRKKFSKRLGVAPEFVGELYDLSSLENLQRVFDTRRSYRIPTNGHHSHLFGLLRQVQGQSQSEGKRSSQIEDSQEFLAELERISEFVSELKDSDVRTFELTVSSWSPDDEELKRRLANVIAKIEERKKIGVRQPYLANLPIRFHVEELESRGRYTLSFKEYVGSHWRKLSSHRSNPRFNSITYRDDMLDGSGIELTQDQKQLFRDTIKEWRNLQKRSASFRETVQINNRFLKSFAEFLLPEQSAVFYQVAVFRHGLVDFFLRPDVIKDFEITKDQLAEMKLVTKECADQIEAVGINYCAEALEIEVQLLTQCWEKNTEQLFGYSKQEVLKKFSATIAAKSIAERINPTPRTIFTPKKTQDGDVLESP
jgi:hypothetical protein